MIKYGLISETDARVLEKTIDLICDNWENKSSGVYVTEIGLYSGNTGKGISDYIFSKGKVPRITGIDNNKDGEKLLNKNYYNERLIIGNSNEVYNQLPDNSQHLIFFDGDHTKIGVISDFFAYKNKVKPGGYICFHDTAPHIKEFKDFQHGDKNNPEAYISVRAALKEIHLIDVPWDNLEADGSYIEDWELVFDEADPENEAGGVTVFRKLK